MKKTYVSPYSYHAIWNKRLSKFKRYRTPFKVWNRMRRNDAHFSRLIRSVKRYIH